MLKTIKVISLFCYRISKYSILLISILPPKEPKKVPEVELASITNIGKLLVAAISLLLNPVLDVPSSIIDGYEAVFKHVPHCIPPGCSVSIVYIIRCRLPSRFLVCIPIICSSNLYLI